MRGKRCISFVLLLLFVAAVGCRLSASFMCSCTKDCHSVEHVCCHCADHISTCAHHDHAMKRSCCAFHDMAGDSMTLISSSENKIYKHHTTDLAFIYCALYQVVCSLRVDQSDDAIEDHHRQFTVDEWSIVSYSLSSPPALV